MCIRDSKGTAFTKARQNKKHLITSAFEHHAIMHSMASLERLGFEVTYIKPTSEGYIRPEDVEAAIRPDTALVSIMMANNEIGTIQPIQEIAEDVYKRQLLVLFKGFSLRFWKSFFCLSAWRSSIIPHTGPLVNTFLLLFSSFFAFI